MTPEEKANSLVDNFRIILMNEDTECGNEILCTSIAIKHAQICVSEVLNQAKKYNHKSNYIYYLEVKNILNNM